MKPCPQKGGGVFQLKNTNKYINTKKYIDGYDHHC